MSKKLVWLIVSCLMVAVLILASCKPPVTEEKEVKGVVKEPEKKAEKVEEVEEVEEKPAPGEPQRGGTLTYFNYYWGDTDPPSPDIADGYWSQTQWLIPIQEQPQMGNFVKYGPRGSNEYPFQLIGYIPDAYLDPYLLESWEMSPEQLVWHVRPGIYWAADNVDWMENRELIAEDVAADLIYFRDEAPAGKHFGTLVGDIYAEDRYTVVIETKGYDIYLMYIIGYEDRALITPPEMVEAGADRWKNQVGTGPFMLKEYTIGCSITYERNPNWWHTATINGVEYQLPFVDELKVPIIPDESTQLAALRTGVIDYFGEVPSYNWAILDSTAAGILSSKSAGGDGISLGLQCREPPFDKVEVRRAMAIATDREAFVKLYGVGPLPTYWYPQYPTVPDAFVPLKDRPSDIQLLFDYNPELAKKMLADAGYPDGFKTYITTDNDPWRHDWAALFRDQWAKIGVEVEIIALDLVTYEQQAYGGLFKGCCHGNPEATDPIRAIRELQTGAWQNHAGYSNPVLDELVDAILAEPDVAKRNLMTKEASEIVLRDAPTITPCPRPMGHYWWPWVKNYYGERSVGDESACVMRVLAHAWLDQDLKAEMGH